MIKKSFTVIEIIVVCTVIGILATGITVYFGRAKESARYSRAKSELRQIVAGLEHYLNDNGNYPADVTRGLPNGIEEYLPAGEWLTGPWQDSVYDWDNWTVDDVKTYQISLRFCSADASIPCQPPAIFPTFDRYSALYYCIEGNCRSHSSRPADHPGLCINCNQDEKAVLWGGE